MSPWGPVFLYVDTLFLDYGLYFVKSHNLIPEVNEGTPSDKI